MKSLGKCSAFIGIVFLINLSSACNNENQTDRPDEVVKKTILQNERDMLNRWYNGDPMGFIDNS